MAAEPYELEHHRKAAEAGDADAQYRLGLLYEDLGGAISATGIARAIEWYGKAAAQGHARARQRLAGARNEQRRQLNYDAAEGGDAEAQYQMGLWAESGSQGLLWAMQSHRKAAAQGHAFAKEALERAGAIVEGCRAAAESGDAEAQYQLGLLLGGPEALPWYRKAADQGHPSAQTALAYKFLSSDVAEERAETVSWFRKAAEQGEVYAQAYLARYYAGEKGMRFDGMLYDGHAEPRYAEGIAWCRKAAEQGNAEMQRELGHYYAEGRGVARDPAEAFAWFLRAAEQDDLKAQSEVARCYEHGIGTARDPSRAFAWYLRAELAGEVARCYEHGLGTPPDRAEAAFWYRRACDFDRLEAIDPEQAAVARKERDDARDADD
jgi:hypothetical protein